MVYSRSWLTALLKIYPFPSLILQINCTLAAIESAADAMRAVLADTVKGLAAIPGHHGAHDRMHLS